MSDFVSAIVLPSKMGKSSFVIQRGKRIVYGPFAGKTPAQVDVFYYQEDSWQLRVRFVGELTEHHIEQDHVYSVEYKVETEEDEPVGPRAV